MAKSTCLATFFQLIFPWWADTSMPVRYFPPVYTTLPSSCWEKSEAFRLFSGTLGSMVTDWPPMVTVFLWGQLHPWHNTRSSARHSSSPRFLMVSHLYY